MVGQLSDLLNQPPLKKLTRAATDLLLARCLTAATLSHDTLPLPTAAVSLPEGGGEGQGGPTYSRGPTRRSNKTKMKNPRASSFLSGWKRGSTPAGGAGRCSCCLLCVLASSSTSSPQACVIWAPFLPPFLSRSLKTQTHTHTLPVGIRSLPFSEL